MKQEVRIEAGRPPSPARLALVWAAIVFVAYSVAVGLAKTLPTVLFGAA